ncbi:aspartate kinase [Acinetobacter baumannii]|nr:aspartate kinase [Acinetobacter baumannii]
MALIVQKYGGTSMGTPERILNVARRVKRWHDHGHKVVVVVSAMSGETNRLLALAKAITETPDPRELDQMVSTGEQVTISMLAMALNSIGVEAKSYTGRQVGIKTDSAFTKARIESIDTDVMTNDLDAGRVIVVAGFQGFDANGNTTTLGRGGSDTSGVAIAAALKADECQIYTDVDGVYTTDPRVAPKAKKIDRISFEEMLEMASLGSKVLQITEAEDTMEQPIIAGIAFNRDEAKLTILGVPDEPGIASKILSPVSDANIEVDMIVQNVEEDGTTDFTFTVNRVDLAKAEKILNETAKNIGAREVSTRDDIVKVSIVGVGMRSHAGVASKMFTALADEGINILMISTSEIKVSVIIDEKYLELAVRCLHTAFGLDREHGESSARA